MRIAKKEISWLSLGLELLVVFLGISAGFFLQNYGERKQNRQMEQNYLDGFRADLVVNEEMLREQMTDDSTWLARNTYALPLIQDGSLDADSAVSLVMRMSYFSRFTPQDITYLNIVNSGTLGLISDYDLRTALVSYHKELEDFEMLEEYFHHYSKNYFIPYVSRSFDMLSQRFTREDEFLGTEFKNAFGIMYSLRQQRLKAYQDLQTSTRMLRQELGN